MHTVAQSLMLLCLVTSHLCNVEIPSAQINNEIKTEQILKPASSEGRAISRSYSSALISESVTQATASIEAAIGESCNDDAACLSMASQDRIGLEAIKSLHRQLDDDANGNVDFSESDEFLREELKYEEGYEKRQQAFHRNDDKHISVRELWEAWIRSEVHNWTVEQTSDWLASNVELPQYIPTFIRHHVTGATLPRLAVNNMHYLNNVLGIKDPIHKQKIALKAMDVVLFGPPKDYGHHLKDLILVTLLLGALIGCWYAYRQNKSSKKHLKRMMKEMESLYKAEKTLDHLQRELERARQEQECVTTEKQNLERRLLEQGADHLELRSSCSDLEVSRLKAEIEVLRGELQRAEGELEDRCWSPPVGLQQWLQLTHEIENKAYFKKRVAAEKQLQQARDACEKLRKKRSSLVGAFVSTHGKSIDDVDRTIVEARTAFNEVTQELQERVHRWKQIELLCGFNIINNNGLPYLESILYRGSVNGRPGIKGRMGSSQDDLDDECSSLYSPSTGCLVEQWREADSSGSETGGRTEEESPSPETGSIAGNVSFTVGDSSWGEDNKDTKETKETKEIKPTTNIVRCYSHDTSLLFGEKEISPPKLSHSESNLNGTRRMSRRTNQDDETNSTDSNSTLDSEDVRRKKRTKLFPAFSKKNRPKSGS